MSNESLSLEQVLARLNEKELAAYKLWQSSNKPEISPVTAARMYTLFLQGTSCENIQKLNPGFHLSQIVHARIKGEWDKQRDEYLRDLLELTRLRVLQSTLESTQMVADLLTVANQQYGQKLKTYLLTGNQEDLGELRIDSLKDYKEAVQLLQMLTGQDKKQQVDGQITVKHDIKADITSENAASILKLLAGD